MGTLKQDFPYGLRKSQLYRLRGDHPGARNRRIAGSERGCGTMSNSMFRRLTFVISLLLLGCLLTTTACAKNRRGSASSADNTPGSFDYYLLTLSWAPEFCATHAGNASSSACDPGRHFGFVVHGLWPENNNGSYPQDCAPAQPVAQQTVQHMLAIMPARGLIQHE